MEDNLLAVNDRFAAARSDDVDLLVLLMRMYKRNTGAGGQVVDADFRAGQPQHIVQLGTGFCTNICFAVICPFDWPPLL